MPPLDDALRHAYRAAHYKVHHPAGRILLRPGRQSPALDAVLDQHRAGTWAFITAWNPRSMPLPDDVNRARQRALRSALDGRGLVVLDGVAAAADGSWPEESLCALGLSAPDAVGFGSRWEQHAVLVGSRGGVAMLIDVAGVESGRAFERCVMS